MAVETNHSRYTENTDPNNAPDFTKGYDLPEGWQWDCYEDGSGGLDAPNGQSYFSYDLATGRMRNERGDYTYIHDSDWIKDRLERYVLPEHKDRIAFEAKHPDWFRAYGLYGNRRVFIPDDITRVAISPNMNMDAKEFRELLRKAHNAENARFSDSTISVYDFARKLAAVYPAPLEYEGETFEAASMQVAGTSGSRYTEHTNPAVAPAFTKGYDLPEGWEWDCSENGSGALCAPTGERYFSYDLFTNSMKNAQGNYIPILNSTGVQDALEQLILPDREERAALEAEHPDWWRACGLYGERYVDVPDDALRVVIAPGMNMDANEFRELLAKAHNAEAHFSDGMISVSDFARKLEAAYPDSLIYKGETFKAASMQGPEAEKRQNRVDGYSLSSERRDMQTAKEALSAEHSVGSLDRQGQDVR